MSKYEKILRMPHHQSEERPPMSMHDRAAQFAPFAALTGYGAVLRETARRTETKRELDENEKAELDRRFQRLWEHLPEQPEATFTYFVPDERKSGGAYETRTGRVKKIDLLERSIVFADGSSLPMDDVSEMEYDGGEEWDGAT